MKVLLVEDQPLWADQIRRLVEAIPGAQVVESVGTSGEAGQWLAGNPAAWDLALVDLFLAQGNGFDVLRASRQRAPHQKVAVLSNYAKDPVRDYVRKAGADQFFDKSFDLDALVAFCTAHALARRPTTAPGAD